MEHKYIVFQLENTDTDWQDGSTAFLDSFGPLELDALTE